MLRKRRLLPVTVTALVFVSGRPRARKVRRALHSRRQPVRLLRPIRFPHGTTARQESIVDFVARVTREGGPDFVPPPERIATFDNDGTLWSEKPVPFQVVFAFDRVRALAPQHPEWKTREPFASLLKGDMAGVAASGEKGVLAIMAATHTGMTTDEFSAQVKDWIATAKHPTDRTAVHRDGLPADAGSSWPTCARTGSRPSSSPAAASSSCGRGRSASMASRRSRSSAAAAS